MTLIEIMVVLALLGLIATSIGVMVFRHWREGQVRTAQLQVRELAGTIQQTWSPAAAAPRSTIW